MPALVMISRDLTVFTGVILLTHLCPVVLTCGEIVENS